MGDTTRAVTKVPHTPTQRLVTEQVSCYRTKKITEVPKLGGV